MTVKNLRNIAIIAHVDHGKTTLVDRLLQQSGTLDRKSMTTERVMDSNDQERERGITILAKNTSIQWNGHRINIVDTPGHADFGGEVERVLSMVDSVLLLVDAVDGPMPQTRFVTQKAFDQGLNPILVINKVDRPGARSDWVLDQVFDLFDRLGGTDEQLDFPVIYASALNGVAGLDEKDLAENMTPLLELIIDKVNPPEVNDEGPAQMQISALDYNSYVGVIGVGRIKRGRMKPNMQVIIAGSDGSKRKARLAGNIWFPIRPISMTTSSASVSIRIVDRSECTRSKIIISRKRLPPMTTTLTVSGIMWWQHVRPIRQKSTSTEL